MSGAAHLRLFGVPTLALAGQTWALPFERRSQLLVLLALRRGWVGRAEVAALLWPELEGKLAATNLRKTLFRLPMLPWGAAVQSQGGALRFDGDTDVAAFEAALAEQRLADALALREGELLQAFDDDANEAWTAWLAYERERQRAAWRGAALAWLGGDVPGPAAVALSARLLEADPLDETVLGVHVGWLARTGQAAAARQTCDRYAERLADELGLQPGAGLVQLRASLAGTSPIAVVPPPSPAPGGDEGFIGRGAELRRIAALLAQDDCRVLCLLGPGGIGKTRLARRALQELGAGFAQGAAFVSLEDVADAAGFGERLARELTGVTPGHGDALVEVIAALRGRRMLLVLDNFEQLAPQGALLERLLHDCAGLKLLVTSRVRLAVAGERVLALEGLPCPDPEDHDRLEAFDAVRLFERAARRVEPDWTPGPEAAAVVEICRLVEGLPLALELAAAWVRVFSCQAIAAELRAGTELLQAQDAAQPRRHASIEQVFEQSWQRLGLAERDALARLSLFRGGFTPAAARAVAGVPLPVLGALADKSLLRKDEQRLRMHPLVQQLAFARLDEATRHATAEAHAAHHLRAIAGLRRGVERGERQALQQLEQDLENFRAAWQHASTGGPAAHGGGGAGDAQARQLADAALTLMAHCDHRGLGQQGLGLGLWALASPAVARHPPLRAVLLAACAHLEYRQARLDDAQRRGTLALEAAIETQAYDAQVLALKVLGGCALRSQRLDEAREHYEFALHLADERSDPQASAAVRGNLAIVAKRSGRLAEAHQLALDSLQEYRQLGDVANEALSLTNLGGLISDMGDHATAQMHQMQALALCERHGLATTELMVVINLCDLAERRGDLAAAREYGLRGLELQERNGDRIGLVALRANLASVAVRQGELASARADLALAAQQSQVVGQDWLRLFPVIVLARLAAATGETLAARRLLQFILDHPAATSVVLAEARQDVAALGPADTPPPPWPAGLDIQLLVQQIAGEAPLAHAPLLARLRGPAPAA